MWIRIVFLAALYAVKTFFTYFLWKKFIVPRLPDKPPQWMPELVKSRWYLIKMKEVEEDEDKVA